MDWLNKNKKARAVCFSGHRPARLPDGGNHRSDKMKLLEGILRERVEAAIQNGEDIFINGLMAGWDILASMQVIALKEKYPYIRLITIAPFSVNYFNQESCWTDEWVKLANKVNRQSDFSYAVSEHYHTGVYYARNRIMVDNSSELICYWDGGRGGTEYTVRYAEEKGLGITNLFEVYKNKTVL